MSVYELLENPDFVVDTTGQKKSVLLDYAVWEQLLVLLEDLEDLEEIRQLRETTEERVPWEQAKAELRAEGVDV